MSLPGILSRPAHARTGRDRAGRDQAGVDLRLPPMPRGHLGPLPCRVRGQAGRRHEFRREQAGQALLAAADADLLPVLGHAPAHREAELREGLVERGEVPVAFGVSQHPVAVEDQRPRW